MNLKQYFLTRNACYIENKKHKVMGIMVHSTGANNPYLKRYVGPDDGKLGYNAAYNHWNQYKPGGIFVCVHAFIGKLQDGSVATYQTLPWDTVGWHSGSGRLGPSKNANNSGYVGIEICEDGLSDRVYFNAVYKEIVELCTYLCKTYNLTAENILDHSRGYQIGIASNHADVMHWFPIFGKSIDTLKADVKQALIPEPTTQNNNIIYRVQTGAFSVKQNAIDLTNALKSKGFSAYVVPVASIYRVQVGAFSMKQYAEATLAKLEVAGYKGFIVMTANTNSPTVFNGVDDSIKVGSKVKITGDKYVIGYPVPDWVKRQTYTVKEIEDGKAMIKEIVSWVWLKDLILAQD